MAPRVLPDDAAALTDALLAWAVEEGATDLHLAPLAGQNLVRIRVDGILRDLHAIALEQYPRVVSRVKVLADMDITERRRPQDGRFAMLIGERMVDFRVSYIPTLHGESVVLRILDRAVGLRTIGELGFTAAEERAFRSLLNNPSGLIVVTGPTGSGKTTTLYAALQELATPDQNVMTIEDPIEYEIPRVLQTAVHGRIDVTFAGLLRSILRHDPDIIMVGEIRDAETAHVAVRAALTGHLVLTTLHTHRTAEAVATLFNLGVPPYALGPALRGVVAQQLVRKICPSCSTRFEYGEAVLDDPDFQGLLAPGTAPSFSIGMGCNACFTSGYRGRQAIFELLVVNEAIRDRILAGAGTAEIERAGVEGGTVPLRRRGFQAVLEGMTTVEEVVRAIHVD